MPAPRSTRLKVSQAPGSKGFTLVGRSHAVAAAITFVVLVVVAGMNGMSAEARSLPLSSTVVLGAWTEGMDADPTRLTTVEGLLGRQLGVASIFRGATEVFPTQADVSLTAGGRRRLLVSWHLDTDRFSAWASGQHDAELDRTAAAVRDYGRPLYIRPWAEMNADWVDFQPTADGAKAKGGTPAEFIAAWRHVVERFRAVGATNARWVFNPTADTYLETTPVASIWPGAAYVDVLGLDGYNWGTGGALRWRSFTDVFATQYRRLTTLAPKLPVWICETSSADPSSTAQTATVTAPIGQSKGIWWREAMASTSMPKVTTVVLFSALKERDWRIDSSAEALQGLRAALGSGGTSPTTVRRPMGAQVEPQHRQVAISTAVKRSR